MRVVVTGGSGFLGSHLCEALLRRGDTVWCLDNHCTGEPRNVTHLLGHPRFALIHADGNGVGSGAGKTDSERATFFHRNRVPLQEREQETVGSQANAIELPGIGISECSLRFIETVCQDAVEYKIFVTDRTGVKTSGFPCLSESLVPQSQK